jgi:hypothetical protein
MLGREALWFTTKDTVDAANVLLLRICPSSFGRIFISFSVNKKPGPGAEIGHFGRLIRPT